jgi:Zn-dependent peptidase ImmA (M78 family)
MASRSTLTGLNPAVLTWARLRSGFAVSEVAASLGRDPEQVERWESGEEAPTYVQLEKLAYQVYKRPLAIFFFPDPPDEPAPEHSFRTLPEFEIDQLSPEVRILIRDGLAKQEALSELAGPRNPVESPIFREIRLTPESNPAASAAAVRENLGLSLAEQRRFSSQDEALKRWRSAVEERGIFVFKNAFGSEDVSGFCLYDPEFPVIYVNNSTAKTRQIFTLAHELAHLLLATGGVTKADDSYIRSLRGKDRRIEVFCNRFAGELLVPTAEIKPLLERSDLSEDTFARLAESFRVSREVILRRALDLGLVSPEEYQEKVAGWLAEYQGRSRGSGGNYYATQATYLGVRFLGLAFRRFYEGWISRPQLADYLGVRVGSLGGLEDFLVQGAAG